MSSNSSPTSYLLIAVPFPAAEGTTRFKDLDVLIHKDGETQIFLINASDVSKIEETMQAEADTYLNAMDMAYTAELIGTPSDMVSRSLKNPLEEPLRLLREITTRQNAPAFLLSAIAQAVRDIAQAELLPENTIYLNKCMGVV